MPKCKLNGSEKHRINVELSPRSQKLVGEALTLSGATSVNEVLRRAVDVYALLLAQRAANKLILRDRQTNQETEIVLL